MDTTNTTQGLLIQDQYQLIHMHGRVRLKSMKNQECNKPNDWLHMPRIALFRHLEISMPVGKKENIHALGLPH